MKIHHLPDSPVRGEQFTPDCPAEHVLGGTWLSDSRPTQAQTWPSQVIPTRLLDRAVDSIVEIWFCDVSCSSGTFQGIAWRRADGVLYGTLELDEGEFVDSVSSSPLQAASREAYSRIFRLLDEQRLPNLWRAWNYLADINRETDGLERYRQFNIGRQDAFREFRHGGSGNVPAACALGLSCGPLSIAFIAGMVPAIAIENPRQISAYDYPDQYGPRSPTFSRAALVRLPEQEVLFLSGTASILGHRTVHQGDIANQTRESLANVAAVISESNMLSRSGDFTLDELTYRVYLRHADHLATVRAILATILGADASIAYVQADICRADLLVEIEGIAFHAVENSPR